MSLEERTATTDDGETASVRGWVRGWVRGMGQSAFRLQSTIWPAHAATIWP